MLRILLFLLLLFPSTSAWASQIRSETRTDPSWKEEPSSFMGIRLGVPVKEQFKECPPDLLDRVGLIGADRQCLVRYDDESAGLYEWKPPDIGVRLLDMTMYLADDSVEGVSVNFVGYDWFRMRDLLTLKYGLPHLKETSMYTTKSGERVPGQVLTWRGTNATMTLSEFGSKVDESIVTLRTKARAEYLNHEKVKP